MLGGSLGKWLRGVVWACRLIGRWKVGGNTFVLSGASTPYIQK